MIAGRKLLVLDGAHAGAELFLAEGSYTIGAQLDCDLVLLDTGVEPQHLRLRIEGDRVSAERLGGAQVMLHGAALEEKFFLVLNGDVVHLGAAAFSVTSVEAAQVAAVGQPADAGGDAAAEPEPAPGRRRRGRFVLPLSIMTVVLGTGMFFGSGALETSRPQPAPAREAAAQELGKALAKPAPVMEKKDDLVARVREFIGDDTLDVRLNQDGRIVVSGSTSKAAVKEQLQRIKKEYAQTIEIVDEVAYVLDRTQRNKLFMPQRITNVSVGKVRWFSTADGTRNFEGSQLADGAEVVKIDMDSIVFRRDGKLTVFQLKDKE